MFFPPEIDVWVGEPKGAGPCLAADAGKMGQTGAGTRWVVYPSWNRLDARESRWQLIIDASVSAVAVGGGRVALCVRSNLLSRFFIVRCEKMFSVGRDRECVADVAEKPTSCLEKNLGYVVRWKTTNIKSFYSFKSEYREMVTRTRECTKIGERYRGTEARS